MLFFSKRKKNEASPSFRRAMAAKLDGRHLKYVTERLPDGESVIGREGALIERNGELLVYASADVVFRCPVTELQMSELLSMEGVILTGADGAHDGKIRTVIAYYTYYRDVRS